MIPLIQMMKEVAPDYDVVVFDLMKRPMRIGKAWVMSDGHFLVNIKPSLIAGASHHSTFVFVKRNTGN